MNEDIKRQTDIFTKGFSRRMKSESKEQGYHLSRSWVERLEQREAALLFGKHQSARVRLMFIVKHKLE